MLARKTYCGAITLTLVGVLARQAGLRLLAACFLLTLRAPAAEITLTNLQIRDPFILPVEQNRNYYLVASAGRWVTVRESGDLNTWGEPQLLFKGSEVPWTPRGQDRYITDGPALYRSKSGKLFMLCSSFSDAGYTTGIAISVSGKLVGPWRHQAEPFFWEDGGHAMVFRRFDGALMVSLHSPNRSPDERCRLIEVQDTGETLLRRASSQANATTPSSV
jgi:hypothetical protein